MAKKLMSLKPVLRTRRSYTRELDLENGKKSFQAVAMYGHEVLMSLQMQAKFL
jgi:extradiol dioxygenase family protein